MKIQRVLIRISRTEQRILDPTDIYYLESRGGETLTHEAKKIG